MVGSLDSKPKPEPKAAPEPVKVQPHAAVADTNSIQGVTPLEEHEAMDPFGDLVPYADPNWYQSVSAHFKSRYSTEHSQ